MVWIFSHRIIKQFPDKKKKQKMLVNKLSEYDTEFGGKKSFKMNPFLLY